MASKTRQVFSSGRLVLLLVLAALFLGLAGAAVAQGQEPAATALSSETLGRFRQPRDIDVDSAGNLYVSDHRNSVIKKFNSNWKLVATISSKGGGANQLLRQSGLAVSGTTIWVADTDNNRIQAFSTSGAHLLTIGKAGSGDGQFVRPQGIAVDAAGNVYVADTNNHRIQVFDSSGKFLRKWGSPPEKWDTPEETYCPTCTGDGEFRFPAHLDVQDGNVYVVDSNNNRVQVFTTAGQFVRKWGSAGNGNGQLNLPVGIDAGSDGFIYVADTYNNRVQKFTPTGGFVSAWSVLDAGQTTARPNGILYYNGKVFVADHDGGTVKVYTQ